MLRISSLGSPFISRLSIFNISLSFISVFLIFFPFYLLVLSRNLHFVVCVVVFIHSSVASISVFIYGIMFLLFLIMSWVPSLALLCLCFSCIDELWFHSQKFPPSVAPGPGRSPGNSVEGVLRVSLVQPCYNHPKSSHLT